MVFAAEKPAALAGAASGVIANDAVVIAVRGFSDHRSCSRLKSTPANSRSRRPCNHGGIGYGVAVITSRVGWAAGREAKRVDRPRWPAVIRVVVRVCPVRSV
jgi:hypothetical protein